MAQRSRQETERKSKQKETTGQLSGIQIMFAAILAVGLILAINFSTRLASSRPLQAYYDSVEAEIDALEEEQSTLIAELEFASSDAYVEQWARQEWKMVRPGEVLVIPLAVGTPVQATPEPTFFVEVDTSPPEPDNWTLWWSLLFDSPPPEF